MTRHITVNKTIIVYPKPDGAQPWPSAEIHANEANAGLDIKGGDDFVGVRPYRPGESQHHIDWKAVARGRPLSIKEFSGGGPTQLWFDWQHLEERETEARLSQLTRWVLEADKEGSCFGLRLPGVNIRRDSNPGHTVRCLEALALFKVQP